MLYFTGEKMEDYDELDEEDDDDDDDDDLEDEVINFRDFNGSMVPCHSL